MKIKKGDNVIVITGKDKGKTGSVVKSIPSANKVVVAGINLLKIHKKPRQSGQKGQIIEQASPIHVSNVKLADAKKEKKAPAKKKASAAKK